MPPTESRPDLGSPAPADGSATGVATLHPGYFALVMATGIVSIAMRDQRAYPLSAVMMWLAGIEYAVLVALTAWRLIRYRAKMAADLADPRRAFGLFTFVAGTNVLGTRLAIDAHPVAGFVLLAARLALLDLGGVAGCPSREVGSVVEVAHG